MKRFLMFLGMMLASFPLSAFFYWSTTCACEKTPGAHFEAWNPLRDRGPEHAADRFFEELSTGQCQPSDEVFCLPALKRGRVIAWALSTRETKAGVANLVYNIEYEGRDSRPALVGMELESTDGASWRILRYTASEWN